MAHLVEVPSGFQGVCVEGSQQLVSGFLLESHQTCTTPGYGFALLGVWGLGARASAFFVSLGIFVVGVRIWGEKGPVI